jgi:hypothetical protein
MVGSNLLHLEFEFFSEQGWQVMGIKKSILAKTMIGLYHTKKSLYINNM